MSNPLISLEYDDTAVSDRLKRLAAKISDLTPVMQEIGEYMILATDQRFEREVDPSGQPWRPLSRFTIEEKRKKGRIMKILQATGLMRNSTNYRADKDKVVVGTNDPKAAKHQLGIGVPKREIYGINEEDKAEIISIIEDYLNG